ncbi:MAG: TolC family protein [Salinivirgaceae bacterium]|nr:TolC family protein [Salinivirgaceae bacterium]
MMPHANKILWILIILTSVFQVQVHGQKFTIEQCISYTLENNIAIINKDLEDQLNLEEFKQSKRNLLPVVDAGMSNNVLFGKSIDPTTNDFVSERLFSTNFYLGAEIDVFKGLTKKNNIEFNRIKLLISHEEVANGKIETTFAVMNAFYNVLYYRELLTITKEQVQISEKNLRKAQIMVKTGLKPATEILEMDAQMAGETYNQLQVENFLANAMLELKNIMFYPINQEIEVVSDLSFPISKKPLVNAMGIYEEALNIMPSTKIAAMNVEAQTKQLKMARGQLSPSIVLGGGYSTYYADSRKESIDEANPDILRTIAFNEQLNQNASQSIYLGIRLPIFRKWFRMSQIQQEKVRLQMSVNTKEDTDRQLYKQITSDIQALNGYLGEIEQLEKKCDAEKSAIDISQKKLERGIISIIEYYTAKNTLARTQSDLLKAKTLFKIKEQTIAIYTGNILSESK